MAVCTPPAPRLPAFELPTESASPSRSPRRKAQFAIRELDPLLGNLSPDSTLKALQATETIPGGAPQDAVASSIADATSEERAIGIRSAFAAQKLREWMHEVSQWSWPSSHERSFGLGFISPPTAKRGRGPYRGFLPAEMAEAYEARIEEIRSDLDSLGIDEIKDHVLEAHRPATTRTKAPKAQSSRSSYGRMRDFTALVTATVIQALPDQAKLNALLDAWDIRLRVLHDLPRFQEALKTTQSDIQEALSDLKNVDSATSLTESQFDTRRVQLGDQVSDLGQRVDRCLDMLEGHDDSLPQAWIDRLEKIELDYATWVVGAQHIVLRNQLAVSASQPQAIENTDADPFEEAPNKEAMPYHEEKQLETTRHPTESRPEAILLSAERRVGADTILAELAEPEINVANQRDRSSIQLDVPDQNDQKGHKREISKVSIADSTLSNLSGISSAEIVEAKRESVLPGSLKVNVVDNPFWMSRDDIAWFGKASAAQGQKPPMLQRASTASIEIIPRDQVKRVTMSRSASFDMLSELPEDPESSEIALRKTLRLLTRQDSPEDFDVQKDQEMPMKLNQSTGSDVPLSKTQTLASPEDSPAKARDSEDVAAAQAEAPSLPPAVLSTNTQLSSVDSHQDEATSNQALFFSRAPALPRRSSKRNTISGPSSLLPPTPVQNDVSQPPRDISENRTGDPTSSPHPRTVESLDDKIQDILTTLPTNIRLKKNVDSSSPKKASSASSSRTPTPTATLTLSPAQAEPSSRKSSLGGPEIKVYHLTRTGQSRDVPPVKLFVRTVGDGDRVMVRVGGGWADLGEYLKEYSLHHGSRATVDGRLEVASFPGKGQKEPGTPPSGAGFQGRRKSTSPLISQTGSESKAPRQMSQSPDSDGDILVNEEMWTPPPVPPLPTTYTTRSPTITTSTSPGGGTAISVEDPEARRLSQAQLFLALNEQETPSKSRFSTISSHGVTTTTTVTPPTTSTNYTPLGAAGPKMNMRRAATQPTILEVDNEAWVKGMVGKARAVSGSTTTTLQGPTTTTTTTTTTTSSSTPPARRAMSATPSTRSTPLRVFSSPAGSEASDTSVERSGSSSRSKSRMSLGDIGGIKRVFLRRKSTNIK